MKVLTDLRALRVLDPACGSGTLKTGMDVSGAADLLANKKPKQVFAGQYPFHEGFMVTPETARQRIKDEPRLSQCLKPDMIGRDLVDLGQPSRWLLQSAMLNLEGFKSGNMNGSMAAKVLEGNDESVLLPCETRRLRGVCFASPMSRASLCSRRHFLHANGFGLGTVALASLLERDGLLAAPVKPESFGEIRYDLTPKKPHFEPRAKAMISLFMMGGPSQMDLFDPKPMLTKYHGQKFPGEIKYDNLAQASAKCFGSPWKFEKRGQCGMELSELLPNLSKVVDEITLIRSMTSGVSNHAQGLYAMNGGRITAGRPALGSWLTYGLGSETDELPAYMVLSHPGGLPTFQGEHFTNGWLPALFQGTLVRPTEPRILNLDPPASLAGAPQERQLALLKAFNEDHLSQHRGELDLQARISSYELAAKMQTAAKEALDISKEPEHVKKLYGVDNPITKDYATRCIIARRLVERGVRYVQVLNAGQSWDQHGSLITALPKNCEATDQPSAALISDLKQRGLLDTTVVHWGGEMGRLPVLQNDAGREKWGRDHNTYGFSMWVAGGGFKKGYVHGETDEFGHKAVIDEVKHFDYHATLLKLFGLDHSKLTYKRNGLAASLTDNQGAKVVDQLIA